MKDSIGNTADEARAFKRVTIVRLDSRAVRIPVEFTEGALTPKTSSGKRTLQIQMKDGSFWAWR